MMIGFVHRWQSTTKDVDLADYKSLTQWRRSEFATCLGCHMMLEILGHTLLLSCVRYPSSDCNCNIYYHHFAAAVDIGMLLDIGKRMLCHSLP